MFGDGTYLDILERNALMEDDEVVVSGSSSTERPLSADRHSIDSLRVANYLSRTGSCVEHERMSESGGSQREYGATRWLHTIPRTCLCRLQQQ